MASYLLQESGGRLTLEDGSGFLLLEATTPEPVLSAPVGGGVLILPAPERRIDDDEDALMTVLALLT